MVYKLRSVNTKFGLSVYRKFKPFRKIIVSVFIDQSSSNLLGL